MLGARGLDSSRPDMHTLHDLLAPLAGLTDRSLVVYNRRGRRHLTRSWAEVHRRSLGSGQSLLAGGCQPGDQVFLQLPDSSQLIEVFLGAIAVGLRPCCLVPPPPWAASTSSGSACSCCWFCRPIPSWPGRAPGYSQGLICFKGVDRPAPEQR